jgi:hypothetical protein
MNRHQGGLLQGEFLCGRMGRRQGEMLEVLVEEELAGGKKEMGLVVHDRMILPFHPLSSAGYSMDPSSVEACQSFRLQ